MSGAKGGDRGGRTIRGSGEGVGGGRGELRDCLEDVGGVGPRASEVLANHVLELFESSRLDVEFPVKILAHRMLHLIDLLELDMTWLMIDQDLLE